jgi:hypothetical protein
MAGILALYYPLPLNPRYPDSIQNPQSIRELDKRMDYL